MTDNLVARIDALLDGQDDDEDVSGDAMRWTPADDAHPVTITSLQQSADNLIVTAEVVTPQPLQDGDTFTVTTEMSVYVDDENNRAMFLAPSIRIGSFTFTDCWVSFDPARPDHSPAERENR